MNYVREQIKVANSNDKVINSEEMIAKLKNEIKIQNLRFKKEIEHIKSTFFNMSDYEKQIKLKLNLKNTHNSLILLFNEFLKIKDEVKLVDKLKMEETELFYLIENNKLYSRVFTQLTEMFPIISENKKMTLDQLFHLLIKKNNDLYSIERTKAAENEIKERELENRNKKIKSLQESISYIEKEMSVLKENLSNKDIKMRQVQTEKDELLKENARINDINNSIYKEIGSYKELIRKNELVLEKLVVNENGMNELSNLNDVLANNIVDLEQQLEIYKLDMNTYRSEIEEKNKKIEELKSNNKEKERQYASILEVKVQLKEKEESLVNLEKENKKLANEIKSMKEFQDEQIQV